MNAAASLRKPVRTRRPAPQVQASCVQEVLEDYAHRGIFTGFSADVDRGALAQFRLVWHAGRTFEVIVDPQQNTVTMPAILPGVPANSSMYRNYRNFVRDFAAESRPLHRRIDADKATVRPSNRKGNVALTVSISDDNYEYGARKLIGLVNETFMVFLRDGPYQDYQAEVLGHLQELP